MKQKIELMSPAGSWEALVAAIGAGADAVYLGGSRFGARQFASNFHGDELKNAIEYAHLRGVKVYVTVNTLVTDSELADAAEYLVFLYEAGADAIIVQDFGIVNLAKKIVPDLPLCTSTQMTVTNSQGVAFAEKMGFARAVLARETSLDEMKEICKKAKIDIEVFVHGALCMSYSGQCLMSSLIGARSGNRGQCAQPCRLPYVLTDENGNNILDENSVGKYLLSPKDLNAIELIPEFIDAGVNSFKIEGRMKRPEYVAIVTSIYRYAIDSYLAGEFSLKENSIKDLKQIFNRDFTTAYLEKRPGRSILSERRPNNRGVLIGRISSYDRENGFIQLKLEEDLHVEDELEVWVSVGGRATCSVKELFVDDALVQEAKKGQIVKLSFEHSVSINDRVFRTFDSSLMDYARSFFDSKTQHLIPCAAKVGVSLGSPLTVTFTDDKGNIGIGKTGFIAETARKHALSEDSVKKQIERIGNTDFYLDSFSIELPDGLMVPVSEINEARRVAIENLKRARLDSFLKRKKIKTPDFFLPDNKKSLDLKEKTLLSVHVDSFSKLKAAEKNGADILIFGGETYNHKFLTESDYMEAREFARSKNKKIYFATPRIISESNLNAFFKTAKDLSDMQPDGILVSNLAAFEVLKDSGIPLWLDYSLNAFNSMAIDFWAKENVAGIALSFELTLQQAEVLAKNNKMPLECIVHGRTEMMVTEYCAIGSLVGGAGEKACSAPCKDGHYFFKDRLGELFPLVTDQFCRMHVLNAKELCLINDVRRFAEIGIERIRIDARYFNEREIETVVSDYKKAINGQEVVNRYLNMTRGHYFRGVM